MPLPLPVDLVEHKRRRRQARLVTAAVVVVVGPGVAEIVVRALSDDPRTHAAAAFYFLYVGLAAILGGWAVVAAWQRSAAARPHVFHVDASAAERSGLPELDEPAGPHRSLTGIVEPPKRW